MAQVMSFGATGMTGMTGMGQADTWTARSAEALRGVAALGASAALTIGLCWMALGAVMDTATSAHRPGAAQVMAGSFVPAGSAAYAHVDLGRVAPVGTAR